MHAIADLLDRLEVLKKSFGKEAADEVVWLLDSERGGVDDLPSLIRLHETLLFLRAYPHDRRVLRLSDRLLASFGKRMQKLDADLDPEVSGIAGTAVTVRLSYDVIRWLVHRHPAEVSFDWDSQEDEARLGETLPRFLPLLEDDTLVEAHTPFQEYLRAARQRGVPEALWLIGCFERLPIGEREKQEIFSSLRLWITWKPRGFRFTRSGHRLPTFSLRKAFFHDGPLIARRDVAIDLQGASLRRPRRLSAKEGTKFLDLARETSLLRDRELYGFTHGDPRSVDRWELGRGIEVYVNGVPPDRRLPLRAYHSGMMFKNGVPVGYVEVLSLFERMEVGFNLYYTFRDGETAWLYARILELLHRMLGIRCFSVDPYQLGHQNEEGIESGAFWFYRKLGFRPVRAEVAAVLAREERKMAMSPGYRSTPRVLRRLANGAMVYEIAPATGVWDRFEVRRLAIAVQREMGRRWNGRADAMRAGTTAALATLLDANSGRMRGIERQTFENFALLLSAIPNLQRWSPDEKSALRRIIQAKARDEESRYLMLLQRHPKLRRALLAIGSKRLP